MGSPILHEFKKQASFFFKEKFKTARLALTDVTPAQLLTEEATNEDFLAPDTRTMAIISRAAFEVDDYYRIADILHRRLTKFDMKTWRVSYKSLLVLEHLLTHGPLRASDEFQGNKETIKEMGSFQFVDEKGFNWGLSVRNLSARILKLLENDKFLKEERGKARKLTRGIQGFGSFSRHQSPSRHDGSFKGLAFRSNSNITNKDYEFLASDDEFSTEEMDQKAQNFCETFGEEDHPFSYNEHHTTTSSFLPLE
ncbi:hypothetical protein JCGZ_01461 [Jatropha curcas]|uniref:ENTH domain-containing protein n=2 Tax=Jatropha curcas TaxID=180498 RepID=A0A067L925_JATCU|nr:hypothetical protein JCGZ_01461 [Jatropha curcas]